MDGPRRQRDSTGTRGPETPHVLGFDDADERRALVLGQVELIRLGGLAFDRATFEPGWRFSEHAGQGGVCRERHLGYLISGRMRFRMEDGALLDAAAGEVYLIPPGHDAWVVGEEPCAALDLSRTDGARPDGGAELMGEPA